jgi:Dolichyl-phosphate-mannose-protein mannosyltransferase
MPVVSRPSRHLNADAAIAIALFLVSLAIRILIRWSHPASVGHDGGITLIQSQFPRVHMVAVDMVPPLYTGLLWCWWKLVGVGALQATLLSSILSSATVAAVYVFARYLADRGVAIVASILVATSVLCIEYGGYIRSYALLELLATLASYWFIRSLHERRLADWSKFTAAVVLMLYTHNYAMLMIAAFAVIYAWEYRRYALPWKWIIAGGAIVALLYLPWLKVLLSGGLRTQAEYTAGFYRANPESWQYSAVRWYSFFTTLNTFNNAFPQRYSALGWLSLAAGSTLFGIPLLLFARELFFSKPAQNASGAAGSLPLDHVRHAGRFAPKKRNDPEAARDWEILAVAGSLFLIPVCIALALAAHGWPYQDRYVLFSAAPYYILVARGLRAMNSAALRWSVVALIAGLSGVTLDKSVLKAEPNSFDAVSKYVMHHHEPGDCAVSLWLGSEPPSWLTLLYGSRAGVVVPSGKPTPSLKFIPREEAESRFSRCDRIWVVYLPDWDGTTMRRSAEEPVLDAMYSKIEEDDKLGLLYRLYSRRP